MNEQMSNPEHLSTVINDTCVSVDFVKSGKGYATEWWVSSNYTGYLQLVGNYNIPIYGYDLREAKQKAEIMLHDVMMFAMKTYGGEGDVSVSPKPSHKERLATTHLNGHKPITDVMSVLERTTEQFKLCEQFKVRDVAQVIADVEGIKVRAVHERIQRCRRAGMLPRR